LSSVRIDRRSTEALSSSVEAVGSDVTLLVQSVHRLVTLVSRHLHLVVLNDVLLDDGLTSAESASLLDSLRVEIGLGDEAIVAGDVRRRLRRAHSQLVVLVALNLAIQWQLIAWLVAMSTKRLLELSLEVATLGSVSLTRV